MKRLLIGLLTLLAAGCTTYDEGVRSYWPQRNVLVVQGAGNGFTDGQQIADYVWLQAAERAMQTGFRYFTLLDQQDTSTVSTGYINTPRQTTFSGYSYGNYVSGTATTTGGVQAYPIFKPGMDAAFQMFDDDPVKLGYRPGQYWDAYAVYDALAPKYFTEERYKAGLLWKRASQ